MYKIKLFTTDTCAICPPIKKQLDASGLDYELVDAGTPEGREALFALGVRRAPYLVAENAFGSEYKALGTAITVESLKEFLNVYN